METPDTPRPRVLLVDDEASVRDSLGRLLAESYRVETAADVPAALAHLERESFDVLVTDICLPGESGVDLTRKALERDPDLEVVVITGNPDAESAIELVHLGIADYLKKPFRITELEAAVEKCLVRRRVQETLTRMQEGARHGDSPEPLGLGRLVGRSPVMEKLRRRIARIQHVDTTVLITGPTGAGKEVVAQAIHEGGHRASGPFLAVNCAALTRELLESELFGYVRGAFTGADRDRAGLIEQANGGTLLLDEVGELPLDLQAKLLRVLEEKQVRRVGEARARPVDVRILAATLCDLGGAVERGEFRADLFFRLNVYPIRVPSLARRREDVPDLARALVRGLGEEQGLPRKELSAKVLEDLQRHPWPGNVRELKNILERLLLIADGDVVTREHLELALDLDTVTPLPGGLGEEDDEVPVEALHELVAEMGRPMRLDEVESRYIEKVLSDCQGNKSEAARILGIHVSTIYRKLSD